MIRRNHKENWLTKRADDVLSAQDIRGYLENPNSCPYCGSQMVSAGEYNPEDLGANRRVECASCRAVWNELLSITGVETVEQPREGGYNPDPDKTRKWEERWHKK